MKRPDERRFLHPNEPHYCPCRKCEYREKPLETSPCRTCWVTDYPNFKKKKEKDIDTISKPNFDIRNVPEDI